LLCHTRRDASSARATNHAARPFARLRFVARDRARQQHHDTGARARGARKKLTVVQLEEFGFFSVLRVIAHADIITARFDLTELIGT
jgi:hypothetical protein